MRIFPNPNYDFIRWRWHALIASVVLTFVGFYVAVFHQGLPLGIEFTGGTVVNVEFKQPVDDGRVRSAVDPIAKDVTVQRVQGGNGNRFMIRVQQAKGAEAGASLEADAQRVEQAPASAPFA